MSSARLMYIMSMRTLWNTHAHTHTRVVALKSTQGNLQRNYTIFPFKLRPQEEKKLISDWLTYCVFKCNLKLHVFDRGGDVTTPSPIEWLKSCDNKMLSLS